MLLATDPKLTEKKFPLVLRDRTAWAMDPLPIMTNTKVPETYKSMRMHLDIWTSEWSLQMFVIQSAMVIEMLLMQV